MTIVAIDDMRSTPAGPRLLGGRCDRCRTVAFPRPTTCAKCTNASIDEFELPTEGTLWTFTVQGFHPKPPYDGPSHFEPYGVGYVDLGEVLVEARLTESDPDRLEIGARMRLVQIEYGSDEGGAALETFAFERVGSAA